MFQEKVAKQVATVRKQKTKEGSFKRYPWNISDSVDYRNKPDLAILWRGWSVAKFWQVFFSNLLAAVLPILYASGICWKTFPCQKWTWMNRNGPIRTYRDFQEIAEYKLRSKIQFLSCETASPRLSYIICAIIISFTHHVCHTTSTDQNQSLPSFPNGFYFKKDNNLSFPQSKEVTTQEN